MATITLDTDRHTVSLHANGIQIHKWAVNPNNIDEFIEAFDVAGERSFDKHGIMIWNVTDMAKLETAIAVERAKESRSKD